jgi:hypothetical protein
MDISTGLFRVISSATDAALNMNRQEPVGWNMGEGPGNLSEYDDSSYEWPGGKISVLQENDNLIPRETFSTGMKRIPGPGEPGFIYTAQKNLEPEE